MLTDLMLAGFGEKEDYNCAERILYGANQAYGLHFDHQSLKMSAGFGGGMAIGSVCGALTAAVMVLGTLFVEERAHESTRIKQLTQELFASFREDLGEIDCDPLKIRYRTETEKCKTMIVKVAEILDRIVEREKALA